MDVNVTVTVCLFKVFELWVLEVCSVWSGSILKLRCVLCEVGQYWCCSFSSVIIWSRFYVQLYTSQQSAVKRQYLVVPALRRHHCTSNSSFSYLNRGTSRWSMTNPASCICEFVIDWKNGSSGQWSLAHVCASASPATASNWRALRPLSCAHHHTPLQVLIMDFSCEENTAIEKYDPSHGQL
jgi:hypothetical protein